MRAGLNQPRYRTVHRVMRISANTETPACRHRWERRAWVCAWWKTRNSGAGVYFEVFPAVTS